jgi:peptidoglycan/xylan/chitin deacetylase (PgdA/CDA1 family)
MRKRPVATRAFRGEAHRGAAPGVTAHRGVIILGLALGFMLLWSGVASAASASVVFRGSSERKQIALTFDDNNNVTRALATLRALEAAKVPATLFVIGSAVDAYPSINREIVKGMTLGLFEVGDHTWSHPELPKLSSAAIASQIGGGTDAFHKDTGARTVPLFRPPYGSTDSRVASIAGAEGFRYLVLWDVDPRDWAGGSAASITSHVVGHAHNGAIVVMHLSAPHTAEAIPQIAAQLRAKGYELVTISTMLKGDRLFLDVDTRSESGKAIARLVDAGVLSGYDNNYFGPNDTITRAQVAKVASLAGGLHTTEVEKVDSPTFSDVHPHFDSVGKPIPYPFDFVEEAAGAGLVQGSQGPEGTPVFDPNKPITRGQLAQILARMARQLKGYESPPSETPPSTPFTDVPDYAVADIALISSLGLMNGVDAQKFDFWQGASRAHVAVVMTRFLDLPPASPAG